MARGAASRPEAARASRAGEACLPAVRPKLETSRARDLARVFKALSDPTRVQIIAMLLPAGKRGLCVCDIGLSFPLRQPTISHHLKVLRQAGLLGDRKEGLWVYYFLHRKRLSALGIQVPAPEARAARSACGSEECPSVLPRPFVIPEFPGTPAGRR